ncbi:MAG: hypothetical protein HY722_10245 [Planctomycetes bacterium]|nr:hypothetical protein [Planctomycetota bacterium]
MRAQGLSAVLLVVLLAPAARSGTEARSRLSLFGPESFTRTTRGPDRFTRTFPSPTTEGRFFLTVANGDGFGNRLSSGTISLNGETIFVPSDFNQGVVRLRAEVGIFSTNELTVEIASNPGSFWAIDIEGDVPEAVLPPDQRDRSGVGTFFSHAFVGTLPESTESVTITPPASTGRFDLELTNGFGLERVTSSRVFLNGVEVVRPQDLNESVDFLRVPVVVKDTNTMDVHIKSGAGHTYTLELKGFVPDTEPPSVSIQSPMSGECTAAASVARVVYSDAVTGVDPATFRARIDGVDVTPKFVVRGTSATVVLSDIEPVLGESTRVVLEVEVCDNAANRSTASVAFIYDTTTPTALIEEPPEGTITHDNTPDVFVSFSDATSGIDAATAKLLMNGEEVTEKFSISSTGAVLSPNTSVVLPDGAAIEIRANVGDCSGNSTTVSRTILVDTVLPALAIENPTEGAGRYLVTVPRVCLDRRHGIPTGA